MSRTEANYTQEMDLKYTKHHIWYYRHCETTTYPKNVQYFYNICDKHRPTFIIISLSKPENLYATIHN